MKAYLLTAATAFGLGAGTVQFTDLNEANAITIDYPKVFEYHTDDATEIGTIETFIAGKLCPVILSESGLSVCPAAKMRDRGVTFHWPDDGGIDIRSNLKLPASLVFAAPE